MRPDDSNMSPGYREGMHRTTFRIDEEILAEAKALAARQHRSLNSVMEEALRRMIREPPRQAAHRHQSRRAEEVP